MQNKIVTAFDRHPLKENYYAILNYALASKTIIQEFEKSHGKLTYDNAGVQKLSDFIEAKYVPQLVDLVKKETTKISNK